MGSPLIKSGAEIGSQTPPFCYNINRWNYAIFQRFFFCFMNNRTTCPKAQKQAPGSRNPGKIPENLELSGGQHQRIQRRRSAFLDAFSRKSMVTVHTRHLLFISWVKRRQSPACISFIRFFSTPWRVFRQSPASIAEFAAYVPTYASHTASLLLN